MAVHLMRQRSISLDSQIFSFRGEFGDDISLSLRPLHYWDRAANQHEEIVGSPHVVGHDVLEVQPEELPAQFAVEFGRQHIAESYLPYQGIAAFWSQLNSDIRDRIESPEIQGILASLAFDPIYRGFDCQPPNDLAHFQRLRMKCNGGSNRSDSQHDNTRAFPTEIGIEFKRSYGHALRQW